ncbi:hypothetical protein Tco_1153813, partial [Tanacetum coccineum]
MKTVSRIWHKAKLQANNGSNVDLISNMPRVVGGKKVKINLSLFTKVPLRRRSNIQALAKSVSVSKSTLHRKIKEGVLRAYTNAIKLNLTPQNKITRLRICLSMVVDRPLLSPTPKFYDMSNIVHIDENWFYMSKPTKHYYLVPGEDEL